jgi:hypothetical protein
LAEEAGETETGGVEETAEVSGIGIIRSLRYKFRRKADTDKKTSTTLQRPGGNSPSGTGIDFKKIRIERERL